MKGQVSVQSDCAWLLPVPRQQVACITSAMLGISPCPWLQVDVQVVRDGRMAQLNRQHMQCSGPTNVLSFPSSQNPQCDEPSDKAVGTLIMAVDTVRREAVLYGQDAAEYTVWLLAHGMGHLMGHDHGPDMDSLCAEFFSVGLEQLERFKGNLL